jgi:hypothetical protein
MAKASEAMAKFWPLLPHLGDNNKPLVDCWPKWDPTADRWANDDPPLAPCPLVDKEDPVGCLDCEERMTVRVTTVKLRR